MKFASESVMKDPTFISHPAFVKIFKYVGQHPEVVGNTYFTAYGIRPWKLFEPETDDCLTDEES